MPPSVWRMLHRLLVRSVVLLLTSALPAQFFVSVGSEVRQSTRATWIGRSGEQSVAIDYGQPKWRPDYEAFVLQDTATPLPLGKGASTTLRTDVELAFGTHKLPRGRWYVGARREAKQAVVLGVVRRRSGRCQWPQLCHHGGSTEPDLRMCRCAWCAMPPSRWSCSRVALRRQQAHAAQPRRWRWRSDRSASPRRSRRRSTTAGRRALPEFALTAAGKGTRTEFGTGLRGAARRRRRHGPRRTTSVRAALHRVARPTARCSTASLVRGEPAAAVGAKWVVPGFCRGAAADAAGGDVCRLTIPAALGLRRRTGLGSRVPANAVLVYTVTLMGIEAK
jgi:hypothetical protein